MPDREAGRPGRPPHAEEDLGSRFPVVAGEPVGQSRLLASQRGVRIRACNQVDLEMPDDQEWRSPLGGIRRSFVCLGDDLGSDRATIVGLSDDLPDRDHGVRVERESVARHGPELELAQDAASLRC